MKMTAESERLSLKAELDVKTSLLYQENGILLEERKLIKAVGREQK